MIDILLADDDETMRVFLSRALGRVGYRVTPVESGDAALPLIVPGAFDLLITDIVMPGIDGIELARLAAERAPEMRVMFITGFAAVALKRPDAPPEARILSKPFHLRELVVEVERVFALDSASHI